MNNLSSKISGRILAFCFLAIAMTLPKSISKGCGPAPLEYEGYTFINPNIVNRAATYAPYFLPFENFHKISEADKNPQVNDNLREWQSHFCETVTIGDLHKIIYKTPVKQLRALRTNVKQKNRGLQGPFARNTVAIHFKENKCTETLTYLIFAKRCEPHVIATADSWEAPLRNVAAMNQLIDAGLKEFKKTKSQYMRLRYFYQIIRLAHYAEDYERVLELFDFLEPQTDEQESIINYWILGHKAGALKKMGRNAEAAYLYSIIFKNAPSKRETAFRSFQINTDQEWKDCLLLCENDQERATLFAIRANADQSRIAEEMDMIYKLDPDNENLELLLVKEMKKIEKDFLGRIFNDKDKRNAISNNKPRANAKNYLINLQNFVQKVVDENKITNIDLWKIARGYLELLSGDLYAASKTFLVVEKEVTNLELKEQLEVMQLVLAINLFSKPSNEMEDQVFEIISTNVHYKRYNDFPDMLNDKLAYLYSNSGHPGKAFRMQHKLSDLKPNPQMEIIKDLLAICKKENKTALEKEMVTYQNGQLMTATLMEMEGTKYFADGKPEPALKIFRGLSTNELNAQRYNPFYQPDRLNDCISCPLPDSSVMYNKKEIIEKIFELEYQTKADYINGSKHFYELGNAYYNMTYFGHAWHVMDYFRSGNNWEYNKDQIYFSYGYPFGNKEYTDCSTALNFFEKARSTTNDLELAARAAFMAAKCEMNRFYFSKDCNYFGYTNEIPRVPDEYLSYYKMLEEDYSATRFYKRVIQECKFFKAYALK